MCWRGGGGDVTGGGRPLSHPIPMDISFSLFTIIITIFAIIIIITIIIIVIIMMMGEIGMGWHCNGPKFGFQISAHLSCGEM